MQAATVAAGKWWAAPARSEAKEWIANYQQSLQARHRSAIVEIVRELAPASILEIGCHCGPNLIRLAETFPALYVVGVDANADAITAGQQWAKDRDLDDRVELQRGQFPAATESLKTGVVDVVLSCYTLAYVAPGDLDAALYEVGRLATRAVILAEPMCNGHVSWGDGYHEWGHDYGQETQWVSTMRGMTWTAQAITPPIDRLDAIRVGVRA